MGKSKGWSSHNKLSSMEMPWFIRVIPFKYHSNILKFAFWCVPCFLVRLYLWGKCIARPSDVQSMNNGTHRCRSSSDDVLIFYSSEPEHNAYCSIWYITALLRQENRFLQRFTRRFDATRRAFDSAGYWTRDWWSQVRLFLVPSENE
jgi:hypothetical protein